MKLDEDNQLCCPVCGHTDIHIDHVMVAARHEDKEEKRIGVDALNGTISILDQIPGVQGRRQRVVLVIDCEFGHRQYLVFRQHKGSTLVEYQEQA